MTAATTERPAVREPRGSRAAAWRSGLLALLLAWLMPAAMARASSALDETQMIRGLQALPLITAEEASALPQPQGPVQLTLWGEPLPCDEATNAYFIPQSSSTAYFEGEVTLVRREGYEYFLYASSPNKNDALAGSAEYVVYGVCGDVCEASSVIFTPLPVICLTTADGELPTKEDGMGTLRAFALESGKLLYTTTFTEINLRGNTSKRFPKQSYRLQLVNEDGDKRKLSFAGLRSDDDWILNPMYADTSKIRKSWPTSFGVKSIPAARAPTARALSMWRFF